MKAREALSHIEKQGWVVATIRGSHHKLRHPDHGWQIFAHRPQDEIPASELPQLDKRFSLNPSLTNHAEDVQVVKRQQVRQQGEEHQHRLPRGFPFDRKRFANALQVARLSAGSTRSDLALKLGLDEASIRNYEAERHQPTLERLYAIKDYFGWSDFYGAIAIETLPTTPPDKPDLFLPENVPSLAVPSDIPTLTAPADKPSLVATDEPVQTDPDDKPRRTTPQQTILPQPTDNPPLPISSLTDVKAAVVAELDKLLFQVSNLEDETRILRQENERLRERLNRTRKLLEEEIDD